MKRLTALKVGDVIREAWLHDLVRSVNELNDRVGKLEAEPLNIGIADQQQRLIVAGAANAIGGGGSMPTSLTWTATSRSSASQTASDSNGDTFSYSQATRFVMTASDGTNSYSWTFNYPT